MSNTITIRKPDDWHLHLRDGSAMASVLPYSAKCFARGIIMPNLKPPVTTVEQAISYRERIIKALPENLSFRPYMTIYLTDNTTPEIICEAAASQHILGAKLYPAGATTNSDAGVTDIWKMDEVLAQMEESDLPLLVHGELLYSDSIELDIFDRESSFINEILVKIADRFPKLRIVLEHITTKDAVDFVKDVREGISATITAHHLLENRNALFKGGIRPHYFCLPVLKSEEHRTALVEAAISGNPKFFLGTDSAPHAQGNKENACGCAGCFTAMAGLELYAEVFDKANALHELESFASVHGAKFYGLDLNTETVTLVREPWQIPESLPFGDNEVVIPIYAGEILQWKVAP